MACCRLNFTSREFNKATCESHWCGWRNLAVKNNIQVLTVNPNKKHLLVFIDYYYYYYTYRICFGPLWAIIRKKSNKRKKCV